MLKLYKQLSELINEYKEQAVICSAIDYDNKDSVKVNNNAVKRMYEIIDTIVSQFGDNGVKEFSTLLDITDHGINIWAAPHLLEKMKTDVSTETKALAIIKDAAKQDNVHALGFQYWLKEWENKKLNTLS